MPDIALSDVKVSDYDAVLFSGGWGASMYHKVDFDEIPIHRPDRHTVCLVG
jgi:putative intracellular protease/amidase